MDWSERFIVQEYPETDPQALTDFYREPLRKREEARKLKEVIDMAFEAIDEKALANVLANSREKGAYEREAREFLAADVAGAQIALNGKTATTVAGGFRNALKKEEFKDAYRVISNDDGVFLINLSLV